MCFPLNPANLLPSSLTSLALNTAVTPMTVALTGQLIPPPTVTLISPLPNATMAAPGSFTLTANASSPNSSVSKVEFYADSERVAAQQRDAHRHTPCGCSILINT